MPIVDQTISPVALFHCLHFVFDMGLWFPEYRDIICHSAINCKWNSRERVRQLIAMIISMFLRHHGPQIDRGFASSSNGEQLPDWLAKSLSLYGSIDRSIVSQNLKRKYIL